MEYILCESQEKNMLNKLKRKPKQNKVIGICGYFHFLVWKWKIFYLSTGLLKIPLSLKQHYPKLYLTISKGNRFVFWYLGWGLFLSSLKLFRKCC